MSTSSLNCICAGKGGDHLSPCPLAAAMPCCQQYEECMQACVHRGMYEQRKADAYARQAGLNLDGSERRETVADLNPKDIAGSKKPQLALIPLQDDVAAVYELGARKYGPFNWRYTPIGLHAYLNAILRHTQAIINGEDIDQESGKSHLAHIAATAMIVLDAKAKGTLKEDRPTVVEQKPAGKEAA